MAGQQQHTLVPLSYPRLLLYSLAVTLAIALLIGASTSGVAFGVYNPAWDGASQLRSEASAVGSDATIGRSMAVYTDVSPNDSVAVVLSPDRAYEDSETRQLRQFVASGGTLLVAEDFGSHSNDVLAAVDATARIDGRPLRDEQRNFRSPAMPVATNTSNHTLVAGVERLTLNHGTVVTPNNATTLVSSSGFGYLDDNRNGDIDENETLASYPVATVESVGQGTVVVVSDPSIAINAMLDQPDNRVFVRGVFASNEQVILDYSHSKQLPPLALATLVVRDSPLLQVLAGVVLVGAVALWTREQNAVSALRTRLSSGRSDDALNKQAASTVDDGALVEYMLEQHPEWSRERAQQVIRSKRRPYSEEEG